MEDNIRYEGKIIVVNDRLMGRFDSDEEIKAGHSKSKMLQVIKTKLKAIYLDYFVIPSGYSIYYKTSRVKQ